LDEVWLNKNKELPRAALAWHYKRYCQDKEPAGFEGEVRAQRIAPRRDFDRAAPSERRRIKRGEITGERSCNLQEVFKTLTKT